MAPFGTEADVRSGINLDDGTVVPPQPGLWESSPFAMGGEMAGDYDPLHAPKNKQMSYGPEDSLSEYLASYKVRQACDAARSNGEAGLAIFPEVSPHRGATRCVGMRRDAAKRRAEEAESRHREQIAGAGIAEYHAAAAGCARSRARAGRNANPIAPLPPGARSAPAPPLQARADPFWTACGGGDAAAADAGTLKTTVRNQQFRFAERHRATSLLELRREHAFDPGVAAHVPSAPERADSYLAGRESYIRTKRANQSKQDAKLAIFGGEG